MAFFCRLLLMLLLSSCVRFLADDFGTTTDDDEQTLQSLAQTFPLRIRRYGPWLTLIDVQ